MIDTYRYIQRIYNKFLIFLHFSYLKDKARHICITEIKIDLNDIDAD